jgi:hypothetical protein
VPLIFAPAANFLSTTTQNTGAWACRMLQCEFDGSEAARANARAARIVASGSRLKIENVSVDFEDELCVDAAPLLVNDDKRGSGDSGWLGRVEVTKLNSPSTDTVPLKTLSVLATTSRALGIMLSSTGGCNGLKYASKTIGTSGCTDASLAGYSRTKAREMLAGPK